MKRLVAIVIVVLAALLVFAWRRSREPVGEKDRNATFASSMSGVTLIGYSTRLNREGLSKEERYEIDNVSHVSGDIWLFRTRLKYSDKEIPVPIPLTVKWAGDTPVITLTDLSIPGVGTYTARVILYRDQYAGTWSGSNVGGQLFGRIVRADSQ